MSDRELLVEPTKWVRPGYRELEWDDCYDDDEDPIPSILAEMNLPFELLKAAHRDKYGLDLEAHDVVSATDAHGPTGQRMAESAAIGD